MTRTTYTSSRDSQLGSHEAATGQDEHGAWFEAEVAAGLQKADAGDFLSAAEKAAAYERWTNAIDDGRE